jgi:chemotaxis protein methyltransferase CheR
LTLPSIAAGGCSDAYFEVDVTQNALAFDTARRFHITAAKVTALPLASEPPRGTPAPPAGTAPRRVPPTPPPAAPPAPVASGTDVGAAVARDPAAVARAQEETRTGLSLLDAGRYDEARRAFERALEHYPAAVDALVGLAQIHANQGEPKAAITACLRALNVDALCEDAHLLLGLLYRQQRQVGTAIDHFAKAIYINFESVAGHFHLAELYRAQGAATDAAREYRRALWALDHGATGETISGLPVAMIRKACEQQLRRIHEQDKPGTGRPRGA